MTKTKKDLLTNIIIEKCKTLASIDITKKDEVMLSDFIKKTFTTSRAQRLSFPVF